jgi:phage portal protein BeeE
MKLSTVLLLSLGLVSTNVFAADEPAKSKLTMPGMPAMTTESKCAKEDTKCIEAEEAAAKAAAEHTTTEESSADYTSPK